MHLIPSLSLSIICIYLCHEPSSSSLAQTTSEDLTRLDVRSSTFCSPHEKATDLLIVVHSEAGNVDDRNRIRGIMRLKVPETTRNARVVFFMEKPLTTQDFYQNVMLENDLYNDIVFMTLTQNVEDQSKEKNQLLYHWMTSVCGTVKFVLKVQDNVIINVWKIMNFMDKNRNARRTIWSYSDKDESVSSSTHHFRPDSNDECAENPCLMTGDTVKILHNRYNAIPTDNADDDDDDDYHRSRRLKNEKIKEINDKRFKILDPLHLVYDDYFHSRGVQYMNNCHFLQNNHFLYKSSEDRKEVLYLVWTLSSHCPE